MGAKKAHYYPTEHILSADEDDDEGIKRKDAAAFKFKLMETANADPKVKPAMQSVLQVYLKYMRYDDYTAYASNPVLMARGNLRNETHAGRARADLVELGYLAATGRVTSRTAENGGGVTIYRLENPRYEDVVLHIEASLAKINEQKAARKEADRRRKHTGVSNIGTPPGSGGNDNCYDRVSNIDTNTLDKHLGRISLIEEKELPCRVDNSKIPYAPIVDEEEVEAFLDLVLAGKSVDEHILNACRKRLREGSLTPTTIQNIRERVA